MAGAGTAKRAGAGGESLAGGADVIDEKDPRVIQRSDAFEHAADIRRALAPPEGRLRGSFDALPENATVERDSGQPREASCEEFRLVVASPSEPRTVKRNGCDACEIIVCSLFEPAGEELAELVGEKIVPLELEGVDQPLESPFVASE